MLLSLSSFTLFFSISSPPISPPSLLAPTSDPPFSLCPSQSSFQDACANLRILALGGRGLGRGVSVLSLQVVRVWEGGSESWHSRSVGKETPRVPWWRMYAVTTPVFSSLKCSNCYMVWGGDFVSPGQQGRISHTDFVIGCLVDLATGLMTFTANGKESNTFFQVSPAPHSLATASAFPSIPGGPFIIAPEVRPWRRETA